MFGCPQKKSAVDFRYKFLIFENLKRERILLINMIPDGSIKKLYKNMNKKMKPAETDLESEFSWKSNSELWRKQKFSWVPFEKNSNALAYQRNLSSDNLAKHDFNGKQNLAVDMKIWMDGYSLENTCTGLSRYFDCHKTL